MTPEQMQKMMANMSPEMKKQMQEMIKQKQASGQLPPTQSKIQPKSKKPIKQQKPVNNQQMNRQKQMQNVQANNGGSKVPTILSVIAIVMSVIAIGICLMIYMNVKSSVTVLNDTVSKKVSENLESINTRVDTLSTDLSTYQFNNDQAVSDIKTTVDDIKSSVSNIEGKMKYEVETIESAEMVVESKTSTYTGPDSIDYSPVDTYEAGSKVTVTGKVTTYKGVVCEWYRTSNGDFIDGSKLETSVTEETTKDKDADTKEKEENTKKEDKSSKKKG